MEDVALTPEEVQEIVGHKIGFEVAWDIKDKHLNDMLINDCCLILYPHTLEDDKIVGHYCCLIRIDNYLKRQQELSNDEPDKDELIFFDPFGKFIDSQISYTEGYDYPHLLKMFSNYSDEYNIRYNEHKLQCPTCNTCGRYCALFMKLKLMEDDFLKMLRVYESFGKLAGLNKNETIIKLTDYDAGIGVQ